MKHDDENTQDISESMGLFEAALRPDEITLESPRIETVLVAVDGSNQTATTEALGRAAADILEARIVSMDAPPQDQDARETVQGILAEADRHGAGLLVVDAPFGEDIGALEMQSLGSVVDILLEESSLPLLIARHELGDAKATLRNPVLVVDWSPRLQGPPAAMAAALAHAGGEVLMIAVPEPVVLEGIRRLLGDEEGKRLTDELVSRAEVRLSGSLVAAMNKLADQEGFRVRFQVRSGSSLVNAVTDAMGTTERVLIVGHGDHDGGHGLQHARELILASRGPVLAVKAS